MFSNSAFKNFIDYLAYSQREIDKAWDQFLTLGGLPDSSKVRENVLVAWQRCSAEGVDPTIKAAPRLVSEEELNLHRTRNEELLVCSEGVIRQAESLFSNLRALLFITDNGGLNLETVGDPRTLEDGYEVGLIPGGGWREVNSGSNAVGTALATNEPTQMHGQEHFCQGFKPWSCTATCIYDPYDGKRMGVIDISSLANSFEKFHVPLVVSWADNIHSNLMHMQLTTLMRIEKALDRMGKQGSDDFVVFDKAGRLVKASVRSLENLKQYFPEASKNQKIRYGFQEFGGAESSDALITTSNVQLDWIQSIREANGELIGYKIVLPTRSVTETTPACLLGTGRDAICEHPLAVNCEFSESSKKALTAARTPLPVLLLGQTGTGKEYVAKAIHQESNNKSGPFVDINCGSFTRELLSGELFGHVEGAFTGAKKGGMKGKIEAANGGTLFLDEIGEMPLEIQPVFLRVLQEKKIYRLGDTKPRKVDFRLVAATNIDLAAAVNEGKFRKDLFFRISSVVIELKPLCERKIEIPPLVNSILKRISKEHGVECKTVSDDLMCRLIEMNWPGNIRELSNVLEFMTFMSPRDELDICDLPDDYLKKSGPSESYKSTNANVATNIVDAEKIVIENAISEAQGNLTKAAKLLGIAKSTLYLKIKKYDINKNR